MKLTPFVAALALASAFSVQAAEKLSVAATAVPHAEILTFIQPALAEQGVELDVKVFTDYVQPNVQVAEGRMDANFFQHQPYLESFNEGRDTSLVSVVGVHIEPFGAYSRKIDSLDQVEEGATIAIPNDPTNGGRALLLLQEAGLITLKDDSKITATPRDIAENPKNLEFYELEAATLPRILDQVAVAMINTNYALEAGLNPTEDALILEGAESPYVNVLVTREGNSDDPAIRKLADALTSEAVREYIKVTYEGAVVPAF
ncbi:MAG: MetQ/NlpA family ABC transporter substrate-binding protein [Oleiphilaceae bacterium]|nr:MetQ/NlpA family ABC transporter substrate-binding protein [Oleiphilaceae bacterium]